MDGIYVQKLQQIFKAYWTKHMNHHFHLQTDDV